MPIQVLRLPRGIVIYHKQGNLLFKATLVGDEIPKTQLDHRQLIYNELLVSDAD